MIIVPLRRQRQGKYWENRKFKNAVECNSEPGGLICYYFSDAHLPSLGTGSFSPVKFGAIVTLQMAMTLDNLRNIIFSHACHLAT